MRGARVAAAAVAALGLVSCGGRVRWQGGDLEAALAAARERGTTVVAVFSTTW